MKRILSLIAVVCACVALYANGKDRGIEVSVLTCAPGEEVYSLYGHTAIRVKDNATGEDRVFNYGVFDFNTEYFIWKFVLGKTDYICASMPWAYFLREYERSGRSVVVQLLDLTESEACKVKEYLFKNVEPENRVYRYNYLTNNCTTKVLDCVEACVEGTIVYSWSSEMHTYRSILHRYTSSHPWAQDGNDLLLGADVDTILSHRATCFMPDLYMKALSDAVVRNDFQDTRKLVLSTSVFPAPANILSSPEDSIPWSPEILCWGIFIIGVIIMALEYGLKKMFWPLDILIMLAHGLAGCLIVFMFFFSEHPAVGSNWLIGVFNPLPLVALPFVVKAAWNDRVTFWHHLMAVWIALFLLFIPWMPQRMPVLAVPVLATLLARQVSYILHYGLRISPKAAKKRKNISKKKK